MRCLDCQYDLSKLSERRCPECGRAFDPADAKTFETRRGLRIERHWSLTCCAAGFGIAGLYAFEKWFKPNSMPWWYDVLIVGVVVVLTSLLLFQLPRIHNKRRVGPRPPSAPW